MKLVDSNVNYVKSKKNCDKLFHNPCHNDDRTLI